MTETSAHHEHDPIARAMSRRTFLGGALAAPLAAYLPDVLARGGPGGLLARASSSAREVACPLPREVLRRVQRGWYPGRSGQLVIVPKGFNYVNGGISHSVPWGYIQRVPMFWYGPGFIRPGRTPAGPVTAADIAPTIARLIGFDEFLGTPQLEGEPMESALMPSVLQGRKRPRLVVVLVWDAGGRYPLGLWPRAWPYLASLIPRGTWYDHAFVGSSPSGTAPIHANMGTGTFPRTHGISDNSILWPDGSIREPWAEGPTQMLVPTLADLYGEAHGHRPTIATFATVGWHLGMMGRGTHHDPASKQIAALKVLGTIPPTWGLTGVDAEYYRLPADLEDRLNIDSPPISRFYGEADRIDGTEDGTWRGHDIASADFQGGFHTPARIGFQTAAIRRFIRHLGLGHNDDPDVTDLLFLNYKLIDETGHRFSASSLEMRDALAIQDRYLEVLVDMLNEQVGPWRWAMVLTADHGHTADTSVSGGFPINAPLVAGKLRSAFDDDDGRAAVRQVRPGWIYLDEEELQRQGHSVEDVARAVRAMTRADLSPGAPNGAEPAWAAAFPGALLPGLDCG